MRNPWEGYLKDADWNLLTDSLREIKTGLIGLLGLFTGILILLVSPIIYPILNIYAHSKRYELKMKAKHEAAVQAHVDRMFSKVRKENK